MLQRSSREKVGEAVLIVFNKKWGEGCDKSLQETKALAAVS